MDVSSLSTLASHRLYHHQEDGDRQDVRVTRAMCGTDCCTDHRLIISKLNVLIQPKRRSQGKKTPKRQNVKQQKLSCIKQSFTDTLEQRLDATTLDKQDVESAWTALRDTVYNTAMKRVGPTTRKHKDWLDENSTEIMQLLEDKHLAYRADLDDRKRTAKKQNKNKTKRTHREASAARSN